MLFQNILIYFVLIPLIMLGGVALSRNIKQIRAVAVIGSTALIALSVYLIYQWLNPTPEAAELAAAHDGMYHYASWKWFSAQGLNINLTVGVDGVSIASSPRLSSCGSSCCRPECSASSSPLTCSQCLCSMRWL